MLYSLSIVLAALVLGTFAPAGTVPITVVKNAKIWTGGTEQPEAQALAIAGDRIIVVGSDAEVARFEGPDTNVIDAKGRRILPGFNDAHVHFFAGGSSLTGPALRLSKSQAEFQRTLAAFARGIPKGRWITGGNWDHENWVPAELPTRQLIDGVTADWPVLVSRLDGHMALANSVALKLAGIDRETKEVPGGVIVRDEKGNPTGILKDAAQSLVQAVIPPPSPDQIGAALKAAARNANRHGVTSVQDMSGSPNILRVYNKLMDEGQLTVRVSAAQPLREWKRVADAGITAHLGSTGFRMGILKGFADGSLGSGTALLFQPYLDKPETSGIPSAELAEPARMYADVQSADKAHLQIAVHAIGDKANDTILSMFERLQAENPPWDRRLRIEHAQHLRRTDIARFSQAHVIASMQPYHLLDDGRWAEKRIGPERAQTAYTFRSLLDAGAILAFGSDWPVAPMNALMGIYAATTRLVPDGKHPNGWTPAQRISVAEAVHAYTAGSAYASFDENEKGTLEPGRLADLVILSDDIFSIDPREIRDVTVVMTMMGGKVVYGPVLYPLRRDPSGLLIRP